MKKVLGVLMCLMFISVGAAENIAKPEKGVQGLRPGGGMKPAKTDTTAIKNKYIDVAYADKSSSQKMDIYLPDEGVGPFPVIIEIHGGGFMIGGKSEDISPMLEGLKRGYAVVSVGYRLSGEAKWPAAINDVKGAIKYLRANAEKYKIDKNRFATWGGSAGGNLSALAAVSGDNKELVDESMGYKDISDRVQAAVDWFGPIYFSNMDNEFKELGVAPVMGATNSENSAESKYLGKTIGSIEAEPLVKAASPMTYIDDKVPPVYIQHGDADKNIPITQSKKFYEKLVSAVGKEKVVFEVIPGAGHGGEKFNDKENVKKILDFLDKYLK